MSESPKCRRCGSPIGPDAPWGQCLTCLLRLGFPDAEMPADAAAGDLTDGSLPHTLGEYELSCLLGTGGMGRVYRARHRRLKRQVALKMMRAERFGSPSALARFHLEAKTAARLDHPNIVPIYEIGEYQGQPYYAMKLIEGAGLDQRIARGDFAFPHGPVVTGGVASRRAQGRIAEFLSACARAVHYAHQCGVLHRDLKPGNILVDGQGQPHLMDFGIAKVLEEETGLTQTIDLLGTPHYLAPEVAAGQPPSVATDVYGLGAIAYELLAGRPPFNARTTTELLHQVAEQEPEPPSRLRPGIHPDLETICLKCLEKEPPRRYPTAQALAEDLDHFARDEPIAARPIGQAQKLWRWCRRKPAMAGAWAALGFVFLAGLGGVLWQWQRAERHLEAEESQRARAESALMRLRLGRAEDFWEAGRSAGALAQLALILRQDPTHRVAAQRLISALSLRDYALPVLSLPEADLVDSSPDNLRIVTAWADGAAAIWDARDGRCLTRWQAHREPVLAVAFDASGDRVVTASADDTARVWDVRRGVPVTPPLEHQGDVRSAQFDPRGDWVATASQDHSARVWNARTGQPLGAALMHSDAVVFARWGSHGLRLLTVSADGTARLWEARTGRPLTPLLTHPSEVLAADFSSSSRRILTGCSDGQACLWDAENGQLIRSLPRHGNSVVSVRFSPSGEHFVTASRDVTTRLWRSQDGEALLPPWPHHHWVQEARFSPEGLRVVTASEDGAARIFDPRSGASLTEALSHEHPVLSARFSSEGTRLLTRSADGRARIWNVRIGRALPQVFKHRAGVTVATFSPDGNRVLTAARDWTARLWHARSGDPASPLLVHGDGVRYACFSPDGQRVATGCWDGTVRIWESSSGRLLAGPFKHGGPIRDAQFSPDGQRLVTASEDGAARVWEIASGALAVPLLQHQDQLSVARFSPDGGRILTAAWDGTACIWETASGKLLAGPLRHDRAILGAAFSPEGARVVTASEDHTARVWDGRNGRALTPPLRHEREVNCGRFSPDSQRVLTASHDGTARLWNAATGEPVARTAGQSHWVWSAEFSPDGTQIATACEDGTARLWDAATGQALSEPLPQGGSLRSVQFSPDGRWLLTACADGAARLWEIPEVEVPVPEWLPHLAEAVGGQRLDSQGILESVPWDERLALLRRLEQAAARPALGRWIHWFLADRFTRALSPRAQVTVKEYVQRRLRAPDAESLYEALRLCPTNGVAYANLAMALVQSLAQTNASVIGGEIKFYCRRALILAPDAPQTQRLLEMISQNPRGEFIDDEPPDARACVTWLETADAHARAGRMTEALAAYDQVIARATLEPGSLVFYRRGALLGRAEVLTRLGQFAEAGLAHCQALGLPGRPPDLSPRLIDLSRFYCAGFQGNWHGDQYDNDLSELPTGRQDLSGTAFDVRGLIQLASGARGEPEFPIQVTNVLVNSRCRRLHFLHGVIHGGAARTARIGSYALHFENGQSHELPIVLGQEVTDWWAHPSAPTTLSDRSVVAWEGANGKSRLRGMRVRLFKTVWDNPFPELEVRSIDFISDQAGAGPFLVAITIE